MEKAKKKKRKTFTRRDFLKGLGGGAVGVSVTSRLLRQKLAAFQSSEAKIPVLSKKLVTLIVNGKNFPLEVEPQDTLLQVLRERLELKGTKKVCDRGECGGCTVLLEGKPIYSCSYLAIRADKKNITTIEGLTDGRKLHPVQQAFIDKDGYQCGFCTPSFIMTSVALLNKNKKPSLDEIKEALSGNLCRCGNYTKIYEAVSAASETMRKA
jgi:xanthine dehydrogenase YagT iron-sulfur-binding subunit